MANVTEWNEDGRPTQNVLIGKFRPKLLRNYRLWVGKCRRITEVETGISVSSEIEEVDVGLVDLNIFSVDSKNEFLFPNNLFCTVLST